MMSRITIRRAASVALAMAATTLVTTSQQAIAAPLTFTPNPQQNSVRLDALIPIRTFSGVKLPKGAVQLDEGILSVTMIPEWNFDRVPVLSGPIIRTAVGTTDKQGVISGVVLFREGYWYSKYWDERAHDTILTTTGEVTGQITGVTPTDLVVAVDGGSTVNIPLVGVRELHSPRAFAFAIPATSSTPIGPDITWTGDAQTVTFTPTGLAPSARLLAGDPLLRGDGDWSTGRLVALGTILSLANIAQFVPELVLPLEEKHLWHINQRREFVSAFTPAPTVAVPPPGAFPGF